MSGHLTGLFDLVGDAGDLLKKRGETIAVAESSSGGLLSASLVSVSGASSYFLGGGAIYTREARRALLGLTEDVVTMRVHRGLCLNRCKGGAGKAGGDVGLVRERRERAHGKFYGDAAGHVAVALSGPKTLSRTIETGGDDREGNMWRFAGEALKLRQEGLAAS